MVVSDQISQLVWSHPNMEHKLLVVPKSFLDVLNFLLGKRHSKSFVKVEFELSKVEFLAHVDVPTRLWNDAWNKPVCIIKIFFFNDILTFWLWKWTEEIWSEKVRLKLIICQIIRLNLGVWENIWLRHQKHY